MSFIEGLRNSPLFRVALLGALIALGLAAWSAFGTVGAYDVPFGMQPAPAPQAQQSAEANLPFLFAVFIVTWAAFFGYVLYVSRRQREMQGEIEALRRALDDRERSSADQRRETNPNN